ncbi:MAG: o-succinylbenzoate synthase [Acidobacteria bacterium]|nr:o-succinylbenzoate synthase [Acidobacteriota bacterium]
MNPVPRLEAAEIHVVRLPLVSPFTTSFGTQTHKEAVLVCLRSDGTTGWGESTAMPDPFYSYETNTTVCQVLRLYLLPVLLAATDLTPMDAPHLFRRVRGHPMAKAAAENALWDLWARRNDVPLFAALGGMARRIPSGISIGLQDSPERLLAAVADACAAGYHRVKIKIKRGQDEALVREVRRSFPALPLMVDANADYTPADFPLLQRLDDFNLMMMEQPLAEGDLFQHARLQARLRTPVCLDESIGTLSDAEAAHALGSCRVINIKQGRVGGLQAARAIAAFGLGHGLDVWSGGMLETGIGRAVNLHLQTLPGFSLPGDTSATARYFGEDIVDRPVELDADGFIGIPPGPGSGVAIVPDRLRRFCVGHEVITP